MNLTNTNILETSVSIATLAMISMLYAMDRLVVLLKHPTENALADAINKLVKRSNENA